MAVKKPHRKGKGMSVKANAPLNEIQAQVTKKRGSKAGLLARDYAWYMRSGDKAGMANTYAAWLKMKGRKRGK